MTDNDYREKRNHCRLKYLVADLGAERVAEKIEAQTGALLRGGEEVTAPWNYGRFYGIHAQKQPGLCYVGVHVKNGHIRAGDLRAFAELLEGRVTDAELLDLLKALVSQYLDLRKEGEAFHATVARTGRAVWQSVIDQYIIR